MEIDLTIVIAQIINFAALVWLLQRFLYRPIVGAIANREAAIARRLEEAERLAAQAAQELESYKREKARLEQEREAYFDAARAEAAEARDQLLAEARRDSDRQRRLFHEELAMEWEQFQDELQQKLIHQVCDVTGQVLQAMAGTTVADGVIAAFEASARTATAGAPKTMALPITVRSSFDPTDDQKRRLRALAETIADRRLSDSDVAFERDDSLALGVEMDFQSHVLSWSAQQYLQSLKAIAFAELRETFQGAPDDGVASDA